MNTNTSTASSALYRLAVPAVVLLVSFLAFSSQLLFAYLQPGPLSERQTFIFNILVAALLVSYVRSCRVDPGVVPPNWPATSDPPAQLWCAKCNAPKPLRAHHCRQCQRCVLKMDHHCPWTANCVGHRTLPHFMRFLVFAVTAVSYLECFLITRLSVIWRHRNLPHYLGPSLFQFLHLFLLTAVNSITLFTLSILLITSVLSLATNTTTIEGWEIERHAKLLRRARLQGGYLYGPDGQQIHLMKQEFPYDVGIWNNLAQGMGTYNPLAWFWPFSASPSNESGLDSEVNGFEDASTIWPPPDPDRMSMAAGKPSNEKDATANGFSLQGEVDDFRKKQVADYERWSGQSGTMNRRRPIEPPAEGEGSSEYSTDDGS